MKTLAWGCLWWAAASALAAAGPQTVILVRHAERLGGMTPPGGSTPDVGLSEAGKCRTQILTSMLADAGVKHIFTSDVIRTRQTAEPLAKQAGVQPVAIDGKDYDTLVSKLKAAEGVSLVVGHSNTLPEIVSRLGAGKVPAIADDDYDRLFIVHLNGNQASVLTLHFAGCAK